MTLIISLHDGQTCKAGKKYDFISSHAFDSEKKITSVEVILSQNETVILRINFYHQAQRLVSVGVEEDDDVKNWVGRRKLFNIADDVRLIGMFLLQNFTNWESRLVIQIR